MRPLFALCFFLSSVLAFAQAGFVEHSYPAQGTDLLTADFNRDGHTDLLILGSVPVAAFNDGFGGFSRHVSISADQAAYAAIADFNGDGYPDIATCTFSSATGWHVNIYLNHSGQSFSLASSMPLSAQCTSITVGDVNHDHHQDIVVATTVYHSSSQTYDNTLVTLFGNGYAGISSVVTQKFSLVDPQNTYDQCSHPASVIGTDYRGDGNFDLMIFGSCYDSVVSSGVIYYGRGSGTGTYTLSFLSQMHQPANSPRLVRLNGGPLADVVITANQDGPHGSHDSNLVAILNNGGGSFVVKTIFDENAYAATYPNTVLAGTAGDFNGDKLPDAIAAFTQSPNPCCTPDTPGVAILNGMGGGNWTESQRFNTTQYTYGMVSGDFNNDNRDDFAVITNPGFTPASAGALNIYTNTQTYAGSSCRPDRAGPHVCAPVSGGSYTSPVHFIATGSGVTGPVRVMQLWIDGHKVGNFSGNKLNTSVTLAPGAHSATVVQFEYNGQTWKSLPSGFTVH